MPITWYFRSDSHTVNGITCYKLDTTNTSSSTFDFITSELPYSYTVSSDVYIRKSNGSEILLGSGVASYSGYTDEIASFLASSTWTAPNQSLDPTDAIKVATKLNGTTYSYSTHITPQLGYTNLVSSTWTFIRSLREDFEPGYFYDLLFYFGSSDYPSRIEGIELQSSASSSTSFLAKTSSYASSSTSLNSKIKPAAQASTSTQTKLNSKGISEEKINLKTKSSGILDTSFSTKTSSYAQVSSTVQTKLNAYKAGIETTSFQIKIRAQGSQTALVPTKTYGALTSQTQFATSIEAILSATNTFSTSISAFSQASQTFKTKITGAISAQMQIQSTIRPASAIYLKFATKIRSIYQGRSLPDPVRVDKAAVKSYECIIDVYKTV